MKCKICNTKLNGIHFFQAVFTAAFLEDFFKRFFRNKCQILLNIGKSSLPGQLLTITVSMCKQSHACTSVSSDSSTTTVLFLRLKITRAVDPDPHGSAFIFPPESGSRKEKCSNKNRKNERKLIIIASLFKSNFVQAPLFLTFEQSLKFLSSKENSSYGYFLQICLSWIRIRI